MLNYDLRERAIELYNEGQHKKIKLLSKNNTKLNKGSGKEYLITGLSLSPASLVALKSTCSHSNTECEKLCLNTSGQGALYMIKKTGKYAGFNQSQLSRALKTIWFEKDFDGLVTQLKNELVLFKDRAIRKGLIPACRLNITSDVMWHIKTDIMQSISEIQYYGYTKVPAFKNIPENYHVTFSRSGTNDRHVKKAIEHGLNVAVVFEGDLPKTWQGIPVINGDETDARFLDPKGVVVGLRAKGSAKNPKISGNFVVRESKKESYVLIDKIAA